jgi:hypothetical protein
MGTASEKYDIVEDAKCNVGDALTGKLCEKESSFKMKEKNFSLTENYKIKDQDGKT